MIGDFLHSKEISDTSEVIRVVSREVWLKVEFWCV